MSVLLLLFVICVCFITSSDSIAGKFKVGDNVITNKYYNHLYGKAKKGTVTSVFDLKDINYQVVGLSTGEGISEYWLEKDVYNKIGYPPIPICYGTVTIFRSIQSPSESAGWYVGQKVWDIQHGRGIIKEIKEHGFNCYHLYDIPPELIVRFDSGKSFTYCCRELLTLSTTLHPIETKTVTYSLDVLYPEPKCDCSCYQCENNKTNKGDE